MKTALVLTCDDNFIPYTSVVARRIAHYATEKFPIIVISDGVSDENKRLAQKFCPQVSFIEAASLMERFDLPFHGSFSRANYLRLFLDRILADFDRAVYVDSDVSPLVDLSPLLTIVPSKAAVIATHDLHIMIDASYRERLGISTPYFNSGVMVLDLAAIRSEQIFEQALRYSLDHPENCLLVDQDALNAVLDGRWQTLDWRWNAMNYLSELMPETPFIRHFSGRKPWAADKRGIERRFIDEWRRDLRDSPWTGRFAEQSPLDRIQNIYSALAAGISHSTKGRLHSKSQDRRGDRARLVNSFPAVLLTIENAASAGSVAEWPFPESVE